MSVSKAYTRARPEEFLVPEAPRGYAVVGHVFQAYAPPEHTWPEEIVRAIREDVDQEFCPMFCRYVYRSPSGELRWEGRHWIWLEQRDRMTYTKPWKYLPASSGVNVGRYPNLPLLPLVADQTEQQLDDGVCGDFLPFDWELYAILKRARDRWAEHLDPDETAAHAEQVAREQSEARLKKADAELEYRWNHDWAQIKRDVEAGRIVQRPANPKPFVEVHR